MEAFVERFRYKASKARQAQSRLKALERMRDVAPIAAGRRFSFEFFEPERSPRPVATLESASFGYDDRPVLNAVSMSLAPGDRVALLGANGMGKSTLLRGIAARLAPGAGTVEHSRYARIGYFAQHRLEQLDSNRTPLELAGAVATATREQALRDFLGGFGFGHDPVTRRVASMSGGEKTRLALALLILERPNLLLLDEPTNHLDLDMREALAAALQSFSGALVLVSHDRHLLRLVSDTLWLVADSRAVPFSGDIDDYVRWLAERHTARGQDEPRSGGAETAGERRARRRRSAQQRLESGPLRREIEALERRLDVLSDERASIESTLAGGAIYGQEERARLQDLLARRGRLDAEIAGVESAWLRKSEELDTIGRAGAGTSSGVQ